LDWSADSKRIRTSSGDYEVLYFDLESKQGDTHGNQTAKDFIWASNTIKYGDDRHGLQPPSEDKTHINDVNGSGEIVLTGDDFGLVNVFNFPNPSIATSRSYSAHSEHVVRVALSKDNKSAFSIGGEDKALIQWKVKSI
jgi:WD40 repeat protein